jgi:hypothetical protein
MTRDSLEARTESKQPQCPAETGMDARAVTYFAIRILLGVAAAALAWKLLAPTTRRIRRPILRAAALFSVLAFAFWVGYQMGGILIPFGTGLLVAILAGRPAIRAAKRVQRPLVRNAAAFFLVPPYLVILFLVGFFVGQIPMSSGDRQCLICGQLEGEVSYFGMPVSLTEHRGGTDQEFKMWFVKEIDLRHDHDWAPMGCHYSFTGVTCYMRPYKDYFHALPRLPDTALARSIVQRVSYSSPEERRNMFGCFSWYKPCSHSDNAPTPVNYGEPWRSLAEQKISAGEDLDKQLSLWLKCHPGWR